MADGSDSPNYFPTIPSWPSSEEDQEKLVPFETTAPESESDDEVSSHPKPHSRYVTFKTAFKKLAEGDIFEDNLEGTVIRVDFQSLQNWEDLEYDGYKEKREDYLRPPLKDFLLKDQKLQSLFEFLMAAPEEVLDAQVELARAHGATFPFSQAAAEVAAPSPLLPTRPADVPPLWAERTTGREVSPVDWIKMHYGNNDPDNWDPMGLARADLRHDMPLYLALAKWIKTHPQDVNLLSPNENRKPYVEAEEAISRIRAQKRAWARKNYNIST